MSRTPAGSEERIERVRARIGSLVEERQALHARNAGVLELEHNRLEIGRAQQELSVALIARHRPDPAEQAA